MPVEEVIAARELVIIEGNHKVQVRARLCEEFLNSLRVHLLQVGVHERAEHGTGRAPYEPFRSLRPKKLSGLCTISGLAEIPRLAVRLECAEVQGVEPLDAHFPV